jgi:hypothetical protein
MAIKAAFWQFLQFLPLFGAFFSFSHKRTLELSELPRNFYRYSHGVVGLQGPGRALLSYPILR